MNIVSMFIQFSNVLTNPHPLQAGAVARDKLAPAFHSQTGTGASSHTDPPTTASAFSWVPATMATIPHGAGALPSVTTWATSKHGPCESWAGTNTSRSHGLTRSSSEMERCPACKIAGSSVRLDEHKCRVTRQVPTGASHRESGHDANHAAVLTA